MKFQFNFQNAKKVAIITTVIGIVLLIGLFASAVNSTHYANEETTVPITQSESEYNPFATEETTSPQTDAVTSNTEVQVFETEETTQQYSTSVEKYEYTVERVVDGDTFIAYSAQGVRDRIRLIGVDTPESVSYDESKNCKYGKVASKYTTKLLEGKTVYLEFDTKKADEFSRLLAYVYVGDEMLNKKLALNGYAVAKRYPPNIKYAELFEAAQIEAEKNKKGMWSDKVTEEDCNLKKEYYIPY